MDPITLSVLGIGASTVAVALFGLYLLWRDSRL